RDRRRGKALVRTSAKCPSDRGFVASAVVLLTGLKVPSFGRRPTWTRAPTRFPPAIAPLNSEQLRVEIRGLSTRVCRLLTLPSAHMLEDKPELKHETLDATSFGARVAEEEVDELAEYFVETDQWKRLYRGDVDVVYGAKGSGKSALYSLLVERAK